MQVVRCGPNEAIVISGLFNRPPHFIVGGRAFIIPCIHKVQKLALNTMTLVLRTEMVYTNLGVPISITGIAQVKINGSNEEMLRAAAEQFGDKTVDEIMFVAKETLEGHQRAIMGMMSVEQIYRDRKTFSSRVFEVASGDLAGMGIVVISYTIKEISDDVGYLKSLGLARTAEVQRDARIGEADANMTTVIKQAIASEELLKSKLANDTEIARSKRAFDVKKAEYDTEVNTAKAEADLAYNLQAAMIQQKIKDEAIQVEIVDRHQQIEIAQHEIQRKQCELDSKIKKPAEAERYRLEKIAEANKIKIIMEAEAEAEAKALKGDAKAFAIETKAKAEAEQMVKKAEAWKEYKEAALVDMMLQAMPKIAAEIAGPLSKTNKITMVADGNGEIGASRITDEILAIMKTIPEAVTAMTGIELGRPALNGI